jgi:hypothetical protein
MEAFFDWLDGHGHGHGHDHTDPLPTARDWPPALAEDRRAAGLELQVTLLAAALTSGRHKQTAVPCPPEFEERVTFVDTFSKDRDADDGRDYDALRNALASMPPGALAHEACPTGASVTYRRSQKVARWSGLVEWLDGVVEVRSSPVEKQSRAKSPLRPPTHQFAVRQHSAVKDERWTRLEQQGHIPCKCYLGAAVEEFHSILCGGFSGRGEVGLCVTLDQARECAPALCAPARRWAAARYERSVSCVAICEKLLTPDEFKELAETNGSSQTRRRLMLTAERVRVIGMLLYSSAEDGDAMDDNDSMHITLDGDQVELVPVGAAGSAARMWVYMLIVAAAALWNSSWLEGST